MSATIRHSLDMHGGNSEFLAQQFEGVGIALTHELMPSAAASEKGSDGMCLTNNRFRGGGIIIILHRVADVVVNRLCGVIPGCGSSR